MRVAAELRLFLKPAHRDGTIRVGCDGTSTLGHLVQSLGVPLTEVGCLVVNGTAVTDRYRPADGDVAEVAAVPRPQPVPTARFILDVHLGALARRLRLAGVDASYGNDLDDDTLIERANAGHRILLTQDRGLLRRRTLWLGAYVRGARPDAQFADVLGRFAPPLAPWTRCTACNGPLRPVPKAEVESLLRPGTRRTYQQFSRCQTCGHVYWRGAHSDRLHALISAAQQAVRTTSPAPADAGQDPGGQRKRQELQVMPALDLGEAPGEFIQVAGAYQLPLGGMIAWRHCPVVPGGLAGPNPPSRVLAPQPVKPAVRVVSAMAGGHRW